MDSIHKTEHGNTGESARKNYRKDLGFQEIELWRHVEEVWTNSIKVKDEQMSPD